MKKRTTEFPCTPLSLSHPLALPTDPNHKVKKAAAEEPDGRRGAGRGREELLTLNPHPQAHPPTRALSLTTSSLQRDEPGRVGGPDAGLPVADGLVGDGKLAQVVADHVRADLDLVEGLPVVHPDRRADHFGDDDRVARVRPHRLRLLARLRGLGLGGPHLLDERERLALEAAGEAVGESGEGRRRRSETGRGGRRGLGAREKKGGEKGGRFLRGSARTRGVTFSRGCALMELAKASEGTAEQGRARGRRARRQGAKPPSLIGRAWGDRTKKKATHRRRWRAGSKATMSSVFSSSSCSRSTPLSIFCEEVGGEV